MGEDKYLRFAEVDSLLCDLIREYNRQALGRESSAVFEALSRVRYLPAADVRPVVRGVWKQLNESEKYKCSNCGRMLWFSKRLSVSPDEYKFCPNCGAMMEES